MSISSPKEHCFQSSLIDVADLPPQKRQHIVDREETHTKQPPFGDNASRSRSYQEEAAIPQDLRSQLQSIGMKARFNVNRGYGSPPPSQVSWEPKSSGSLITEKDILRQVHSSRSTWARTRSAPLHALELQPFGGVNIRPSLVEPEVVNEGDENHAPSENIQDELMTEDCGIGVTDLKRNRDVFLEEWAREEEQSNAR